MKYLDSNGLQKLRDADSERMNRLYRPIECGLWTRSESSPNVSIYPVGGTKVNPTVEFMFKETPPASGTKSPNNPSTISGVSSVPLAKTGKNVFSLRNIAENTKNGFTYSVDADGIISIDGTVGSLTGSSNTAIAEYLIPKRFVAGGTKIYIRCRILSGTYTNAPGHSTPFKGQVAIGAEGRNTWYPGGFTTLVTDTVPFDGVLYQSAIQLYEGASFSNLRFQMQIELGDYQEKWENYCRDEWTIQLGNTYYGGTIDLSTGLMTVTHGKIKLDGTENWSGPYELAEGVYRYGWTVFNNDAYMCSLGDNGESTCTHFNYVYNYQDPHIGYYIGPNQNNAQFVCIKSSISTVEEFQTWLASEYSNGHPVTITGLLRNPYTVQLTPVQISSLLQNDRYSPRKNTFYTDASNSISVEYLKSPVKASYDIQQAILAQGGV